VAIAFVGSKEGNVDTDSTSYTITDPFAAGVAANQLAIIVVCCPTPTTGSSTFTGWNDQYVGMNLVTHRVSVWYRITDGTETTTTDYTFDQPGTGEGVAWVCCLYSGVDTTRPFYTTNGIMEFGTANEAVATPTLTNPDPSAWWVSCAGVAETAASSSSTATWSADIGTERNDIDAGETTSFHAAAMYDSNGTVAAGNVTVTHTYSDTDVDKDIMSWLGILRPAEVGASVGRMVVA
jgi:hypothetical protein